MLIKPIHQTVDSLTRTAAAAPASSGHGARRHGPARGRLYRALMAVSAGARTGSYRLVSSLGPNDLPEIETGTYAGEPRLAYRSPSRRSAAAPPGEREKKHPSGGGVAGAVRIGRTGTIRESNGVMAPCRRPGTCRGHARPAGLRPRGVRAGSDGRFRPPARSRSRPCVNDAVPGRQGGVRRPSRGR
jgi:hypothetical protein